MRRDASLDGSHFVGRQHELCVLDELADSVEKERRPYYAFVYGDAGIGKTELLERFLETQRDKRGSDMRVFRVEALEGHNQPLYPFANAVEEYLKEHPDTLRTITDIGSTMLAFVPGIGLGASRALSKLIERVRDPLEEGRYETEQLTTYSSYNKIIESASKNNLLIFCVDGAHWLDTSSAELLESIAHKNTENRILFVITVHNANGVKNNDGLEAMDRICERMRKRSRRIMVKPFTEEEYLEIIGHFSNGCNMGPEHIRKLHEETKGNPFWLIHALDSPVDDTSMPDRLSRLLDSELEDAYANVSQSRKALGYAAVLGNRFKWRTLADLVETDVDDMFETLKQLEKRGLLRNPGNQEYFAFKDNITREYIYESLGALRKSYHQKVAELLEDAKDRSYNQYAIAYHYSRTDCKKCALDHMRRAAYASAGLTSDAYRKLGRCLEIARDLDMKKEEIVPIKLDYARALLDQTRARHSAGTLPPADGSSHHHLEMQHVKDCMQILEELIDDECTPVREKAMSHTLISRCYRKINTQESGSNAILHAQTATDMLQGGEPLLLGDAYAYLATVYAYFESNMAKARHAYGEACKCYRDSPTDLARLHRKAGMVMDPKQAISAMKESLIVFGENNTLEKARCLNNLGVGCMHAGEFVDSRKYLDKSRRRFKSLGTYEIVMPLNNLGLDYLRDGDYRKALLQLTNALDQALEIYDAISIKINISTVSRKMGNLEEAARILNELEGTVMDFPEPRLRDHYGFNRGVAHLYLGERAAAEEWLQKFQLNGYKNDRELELAQRARTLLMARGMRDGACGVGGDERAGTETESDTGHSQRRLDEIDYCPCYLLSLA